MRFARKIGRGLHHLIVPQLVEGTAGLEVPVLYLAPPISDGSVHLEAFEPLNDYLAVNSAMSKTWMRTNAKVVGLFFDYMVQRRAHYQTKAADPLVNVHQLALSEFERALVRGTIDDGFHDPTCLYWLPSTSRDRVVNMMRAFRNFLRTLDCRKLDLPDSEAEFEGCDIPVDGRGMLRFLFATEFRRSASAMAHLKSTRRMRRPDSGLNIDRDMRDFAAAHTVQFPREHLVPLLRYGFVRGKKQTGLQEAEDLTAKLLTMLCAFGGLRHCEPLHLWVNDVQVVDGEPAVFLNHPVCGIVREGRRPPISREEYLLSRFGLRPRNHIGGRLHAGWKGILCNEDWWAMLYWLPVPGITGLFQATFQRYIQEVRPYLMRIRRSRGFPDHPFLFVSSGAGGRGDDDYVGEPYTLGAYRDSWKRAIAKVAKATGDKELIVAKARGTTPHGLRHLYGSTVAGLVADPLIVQAALHHISPLSQLVYTKPKLDVVNQRLNEAAGRVRSADDLAGSQFRDLQSMLQDLRNPFVGGRI